MGRHGRNALVSNAVVSFKIARVCAVWIAELTNGYTAAIL